MPERADIVRWISETFDGLDLTVSGDDVYWFYDPDGSTDPTRRMPFATLMTTDTQDAASHLSRPGVFRLNLGVKPETYEALFGPRPKADWDKPFLDTGHDYAQLDTLMPQPVYCAMGWICVLNPSAETFERVKPLVKEAHALAASRHKG
jgi:hypothetical protein